MAPETTESQSHRDIEFEWSPAKAAVNRRKHGVSFEEAATAFEDAHALIQEDEIHSEEETRELILGFSARHRLLVVSFVQREPERVRLISARLATRRERVIYEEEKRDED